MKRLVFHPKTWCLIWLSTTFLWASHIHGTPAPTGLEVLPQAVPYSTRIVPKETTTLIGSWGTGFVIAPGYVLTAYHVVHQKNQIRVGPVGQTATGRSRWLKADLVKVDAINDLALLSIPEILPAVKLHPGKKVPIGLEAFVIGYPQPRLQGSSQKITAGIVNGYRNTRNSPSEAGLLQISAEVSNGNSGGPVIAPDGTVIGMVQKKIHTTRAAERMQDVIINVGYALRSEQILDFLSSTQVSVQTQTVNLSSTLRPYQIFEMYQHSVLTVIGRSQPENATPVD
jgi:S1-C subfamily serine protease